MTQPNTAVNDGQDEEEDEARERDLPGQVDSERGRTAYSLAQQAGTQFNENAARAQRGREAGDGDKAETQRMTMLLNSAHATFVVHTNAFQAMLQGALGVVTIQSLSGAQNANQGIDANTVAAVGALLDKIVAIAPPPTGGAKSG